MSRAIPATGRDRYIEDAEFLAVWNNAHYTVQDAMNLAHLTEQRFADFLKLNRTDIHDEMLWFTQNKTGKKLLVEIVGELQVLLERVLRRDHHVTARRCPVTRWKRSASHL